MKPNLNVNPHMNSQKIWIAVSLTIIVAVGAIVGASILITPKSNSVTCCVTTSRSTSSMSSTKSAPVELPTALCCTTSTSTSPYSTSSGFSGDVTVYAHRIPSSYWAPCFALVCSAGTGPGVTMYFALFDSAGNVVQTGFANENGYNFTGLNPSASYYVYASNCDSCHGASHDVNFSHWGNGATAQELEVSAGQSVDAWYVYIPLNSSTTSTGTSGNYIATNSSVVSVIGIIAAMAIPAIISRRHGFLRLNNAKNH